MLGWEDQNKTIGKFDNVTWDKSKYINERRDS